MFSEYHAYVGEKFTEVIQVMVKYVPNPTYFLVVYYIGKLQVFDKLLQSMIQHWQISHIK